ncbi:MAG: UDP-3-O-(3-hydroxymyristoyl)glucosamine N-acyltransferase [Bacteroidales bacterium]|nr:UDP-3-O-(3-hydroxymyristoyl)glucosamine N-acyltransferase [Bacteroidales bacterium]
MEFKKTITLDDLCNILGHSVKVVGNKNIAITGINEIHSVAKGNISFVDSPKYYDKALQSEADVILINKEVDCPEGKALVITDDPINDFCTVVRHYVQFHPQTTAIHPDAKIGEGTVIQPNVFIGEDVTIGKNCIIHGNVSIYAHTIIGDNVIIHSGASIGADAYYFQKRADGWKKLESCGRTILCDRVDVGANVCIDKGVSGDTYIGEGVKFDNLVQVGHDTHIGAHCLIGAQCAIAGCTYIDDDCNIWARACVNKDLYIAKNTTILAMTGVDKSVKEEGQVLFGLPATDARKKWREMAHIRQLPSMAEEIALLKKEIEELKKK